MFKPAACCNETLTSSSAFLSISELCPETKNSFSERLELVLICVLDVVI